MRLVLVVCALLIAACGDDSEIVCEEEQNSGIVVKVMTQKGNKEEQLCDVTIQAVSDKHTEFLSKASAGCNFIGLFNKPGFYDLTFESPGYETLVEKRVHVGGPECNVHTAEITVTLTAK